MEKINVKEIYQGEWEEFYYDYTPMINAFGEVIVKIVKTDDGYRGDTYVLYCCGDKYGILTIGWGSCAGCDALHDCGNFDEVQDLCNELQRKIHWDQPEKLIEWLQDESIQSLKYEWHYDQYRKFIELAVLAIELLEMKVMEMD